ncbi:MAG: molecular chaperone HtpG [Candidatus Latescibacterota bacterium]|nr:molecular chaperone HtpG [Candidatus Latescibacterota bacterium]
MSAEAEKENNGVEERAFQTEVQQLLQLLIHSLYTDKDVFLRELISNASDALGKVHHRALVDKNILDAEADLEISIDVSSENKTLTIRDTGIGMTRDEVNDNIGTIAHSGSADFIKNLSEASESEKEQQLKLIGQFGVGFYSVFMVADRVVVTTRSAEVDAKSVSWDSTGDGSYTLADADLATRGTEIKIYVRSDCEEFLDVHRLENIVRRHSDYVSYPIKVGGKQANNTSALWTRPRNEITADQYDEFFTHLTGDNESPLMREHIAVDVPIQFFGLLYIPKSSPERMLYGPEPKISLNLHVKRVFIQDDCEELLPIYLRFVRGVVDCDDLPLNVSREVLQKNPVIAKIRSTLVRRVLTMIETLAKKDDEKYLIFWHAYGTVLKEGIAMDFENKDQIAGLLRYRSSLEEDEGSLVSLQTYVDRMQSDQEHIYYLTGEDHRAISQSPLLETFRKRGLEVLLLDQPVDEWVVNSLDKFGEKTLQAIDAADLELEDDEVKIEGADEEGKAERIDLIAFLKKELSDRVSDVVESKRLSDSPCVLVTAEGGVSQNMERLMKMADRDFSGSKRVLEVNPRHQIIQNLALRFKQERTASDLQDWAHMLVDYVLLGEGKVEDPQRVTRILQLMMQTTIESSLDEIDNE